MNPEYELVNDITSESDSGKKYPTTLKYNQFNVKVPHSPKKNCKKCSGKGILGVNVVTNMPVICSKCYPGLHLS